MKVLKGIGLGLAFGLVSLLVMLLVVSAILLSSDATMERIHLWGRIILTASALISGAIASMVVRKSGWLIGLASGCLLWACILAIAWLIEQGTYAVDLYAALYASVAGLVGGMISSLLTGRRQ